MVARFALTVFALGGFAAAEFQAADFAAGLAAPLRDEPAASVPAEIKATLAVNLEMVIAESIIGVWR